MQVLRTFSFGAVALRLLGALLCGAMVGVDREMRNKKAGLKRTRWCALARHCA